nr:GTP-binding protein [Paraburkholderia caribensis]
MVTPALGGGKTSLLRHPLEHPDLVSSMLLVNEAAEYGADDRLLREKCPSVGLLVNGSVCCTVNDDPKANLRAFVEETNVSQRITRIIIRTTGLVDPTPVIATITSSPLLNWNLSIEFVITTPDCQKMPLDSPEDAASVRQLELADVILLTKS